MTPAAGVGGSGYMRAAGVGTDCTASNETAGSHWRTAVEAADTHCITAVEVVDTHHMTAVGADHTHCLADDGHLAVYRVLSRSQGVKEHESAGDTVVPVPASAHSIDGSTLLL
mmetsp:Transcript_4213/g.6492  ORF Transcript_4213/g.6492 Transcript_4213/m.6492 type:complete len:113 (-) Transcript_4213:538-876(-)